MLNPFVSPPYLKCPKCSEQHFGVLTIGEFHYTRRCAKCGYPKPTERAEYFPLHQLNKKIIYLDQFVISNMVKSLHPDFEREIDPFYKAAFEKLDRLSKLQLIVCPDSQFHENESIFSKYPKEHKRVYELLSHGISYWDYWTILRFQICEQLDNWLSGRKLGETTYTVHNFTYGKINEWTQRLQITVESKRMEMVKGDLQATKAQTFEILKQALERWETEKNKPFDYWYSEEIKQWKWSIVEGYQKHFKLMFESLAGLRAFDPLELLPTPLYLIFQEISEKLKRATKSDEEYKRKLNEFLIPENLEQVPFIRIFSMLFANLASRVSGGAMNKDKVKPSFYNDVMMVSSLLPFCDAIFLERQLTGFLKDKPLCNALTKMPKVFSLADKDNFFEYLSEIENQAPKEHLAKVIEVYGENWASPYTGVLKEYAKK